MLRRPPRTARPAAVPSSAGAPFHPRRLIMRLPRQWPARSQEKCRILSLCDAPRLSKVSGHNTTVPRANVVRLFGCGTMDTQAAYDGTNGREKKQKHTATRKEKKKRKNRNNTSRLR